MIPRPLGRFGLLVALIVVLAGCDAATVTPRPDPGSPCAGADEQRLAGFYPDLEALVPAELGGKTPSVRESGRYCSARTLGSLFEAGITELHFAGFTWTEADGAGTALVVYRAPGLTADAIADSFAQGADAARGVSQVHARAVEVAGRHGVRVEAVSGDRPQVVIVWPAAAPDTVNAALASGVGEDRLTLAVAAFGDD